MTLTSDEWGKVQVTLATGAPVLVFGPGCHRVGYDTGEAWEEVIERVALVWATIGTMAGFDVPEAQRQIFLEHFWLSKLSPETLRTYHPPTPRHMPVDQSLKRSPGREVTPFDRARTQLAAAVFGVLFETTRCLGNVIATGASPVTDWRLVSHPGPYGSGIHEQPAVAGRDGDDDARPSTADDAQDAQLARQQAIGLMGGVVELASYLEPLVVGDPPDASRLDAELARTLALEPSDELRNSLTVLKLKAVRRASEHLLLHVFNGGQRLTGALVEWLADLFWHLIVTDSRVPPSQREIAFYLNLRETRENERYDEREFTRARQGEALSALTGEAVTGHVRTMLRTYDAGELPWRETDSVERVKLARTMSATLIARWRRRQRYAGPVVALVPDYDLSFERAVLELLSKDEALHVVVPVWRRRTPEERYYLHWLFGTMIKEPGTDVAQEQLTDLENWRWYAQEPPAADEHDPVRGPILVKLNGSPLLNIPSRPKGLPLGEEEDVQVAAVFTEHDSLQAIVSFADAGGGQSGLATDVIEALNWSARNWVFLGDSFPDWLPRLRLLFNAQSSWRRQQQPSAGHIAVDRRFDWPEVGLLDVLGVEALTENLANLAGYHRQPANQRTRDDDSVQGFLGDVRRILAAYARKCG